MLQMCSRKAWLVQSQSATTQVGVFGNRLSRARAIGSSWAWPGARLKATARPPPPSAITQALVP